MLLSTRVGLTRDDIYHPVKMTAILEGLFLVATGGRPPITIWNGCADHDTPAAIGSTELEDEGQLQQHLPLLDTSCGPHVKKQ